MHQVMEAVGPNLLKLITTSNYKGIPIMNVRSIIRQILEGADYLHTKSLIIHTDLKPENILVQGDQEDLKHLHDEARYWEKHGLSYSPDSLCNLPPDFNTHPTKPLSKNMKKKLKKKAKKQNEESMSGKETTNSEELPTSSTSGEGAGGDNPNAMDPASSEGESASEAPPIPPSLSKPNPAKEVCDFVVKIADFGNACEFL